jgi:cytochrome c oxidase subunit II
MTAQRPARRRALRAGFAAAAGVAALRAPALAQPAASGPRVIQMVAHRFAYEPPVIALKAGERVVVEIRSLDFVHGMNIPALKMRFDLVPGRITKVELQPTQSGEIEFVCDNFCGDGHEQMHGKFVVSA